MRTLVRLLSFLVLLGLVYLGWVILGPGTDFSQKTKSLYVHTGKADREAVMDTLSAGGYIAHPALFDWAASVMGVWDNLKPGRYQIIQDGSLLHLLRALKNGHQTPIRLVINKVRTKESLAAVLGNFFECDSTRVIGYMNNPDSMKVYGLDTDDALCALIPNTYLINWNATPSQLFHRFFSVRRAFWTAARTEAARNLGLTPDQVYILASIVEEETNKDSDKPLIASVYLNRMAKGMPLAADPTVKFALREFELKRIYDQYTKVASPYNTYQNKGLPPGPICTPSVKTLDAVLSAPKTDYLFFVAKPDFSGYSNFSDNFADHERNAKAYQQALDSLQKQGR